MFEVKERLNGQIYHEVESEPVKPPFKLVVSDQFVILPCSIKENVESIISGCTIKSAIATRRHVSPQTVKKQIHQLQEIGGKILVACGEKRQSKIPSVLETFVVLFKSGAIMQIPTGESSELSQYNYFFSAKNLPRLNGKAVLPYDLEIFEHFDALTKIQRETITQVLAGKNTYDEISTEIGRSANTIKKRFGSTTGTHKSFKKLIIHYLGMESGQRLGKFEIFLKLIEYGILRQVPIEIGTSMIDNRTQDDRF